MMDRPAGHSDLSGADALERAWLAIAAAYRADEARTVAELRSAVRISPAQNELIARHATDLAARVREKNRSSFNAEAFLSRYGLSTREGVVLMCLAEAFLRIPDESTVDELVRDKLAGTDWGKPPLDEGPLLLNASAWGLLLTGKLASWHDEPGSDPLALIKNLVGRVGEPVVRTAITQAMRIMAKQFVVAETIAQAAKRMGDTGAEYTFSFDMLGEAARTRADAQRYCDDYMHAVRTVGAASNAADIHLRAGVSIKLSALHPRFEIAHKDRIMRELLPRLRELAALAKSFDMPLTIDAEESERLTLTLELFKALLDGSALSGWDGLGLAVQAYQKRAGHVIGWLAQ